MSNKLSKILIPLSLIVVAAVGFTIAYFQDLEKSENNVFGAGTLDLNLGKPGGGEATAVWQAGNWSPGNEVEGELEFENKGNTSIESLLMSVEISE